VQPVVGIDFLSVMYVWINSSHCCMADILLNVRQAKYLFSTIFVGTNSDYDVINALYPKAMITWKFFLMCFDNEINTTIYSNTVRPVCLKSDQPESPLSETNC